jgi:hypothetical protein
VARSRATNLARKQYIVREQTRCRARTTQCPLATGMIRISRPRGKYSTYQAVTKYLTNNSPSCSDSSNCSNRLNLGVLSHAIIPVGLSPS